MMAEHWHWVAWQVKIWPSHAETYDHIILAITVYHHPNSLNMGFFNLPPTQIELSMSHNLVMSFDIKQPVPVFQSIHTERKVHAITITKMKWKFVLLKFKLKYNGLGLFVLWLQYTAPLSKTATCSRLTDLSCLNNLLAVSLNSWCDGLHWYPLLRLASQILRMTQPISW